MKLQISRNSLLLGLILLVGTALRVYRIWDIPVAPEEFPFLLGADPHPAAMRIPFVLFGIFSIYLVYRLGKEWFNSTVGLIAAVFISCMEFTVMYSQIAGPGISGVMFSMLLVYAWYRYLFNPGKYAWYFLGAFVLAGVLCAYTHNITLLFTIMVILTGFPFLRRKSRIPYLLAGLVILGLFIPHLSTSIQQFGQTAGAALPESFPEISEGASNLGILQYFAFLLHFSWVV